MPKLVPELTAVEVKRLVQKKGFYAVGGISGLYLNVTDTLASSWILKKKVGNRRPEYGLGPYPAVTLASARDKAREYVEMIRQGIDPLVAKQAARSALVRSQAKAQTFRQVATRFIAKKNKEYKTAIQTDKLTHRLVTYAYPHIGDMVVADIERAHVLKMLEPIWETKTETATRVRANVERVLDLAGAEGLRRGDNPARWTGNLDLTLPLPSKVAKVEHFKALPVEDMPQFMENLRALDYMGARALEFTIWTVARSGELRGATWDEIDFKTKVWTVPAERMKGGRVHKIPLCASAIKLLKSLPRNGDYIFHNTKGGKISDVSVSKVPKKLGHDVTAHGFRATFRTWAQEYTNYPEEVPELALAHINSDRTRAAYARSELLDKRRTLMGDWEQYCYNGLPNGDVVPMRRRKS